MQITIQRVSLPKDRRLLVTSDIHGHADDLRALLNKAGFSRQDILIIVGDLIEKGSQSLDTLRLVMNLCKTHTVYPLMGNVDLWRLEYLQSRDPASWRDMQAYSLQAKAWWGGSLLHELCAELGVELTSHTDIVSLIPAIQSHFAPEIAFLESLPIMLETQNKIFVHGGIPHERLDELTQADPFSLLKFDDFKASGLAFHKYVIVGHWPAVLYSKTYPNFNPLFLRDRRIVFLDGGCGVKEEGQLNMLVLPNGLSEDFSWIAQDHLPVITALEDQAPSPAEDTIFIRWSDRWVTVLERGEEMSTVMYHGKIISVPTQYLGRQDEKDFCRDATDYVLPVKKGDQLLVILALSYGCYVKKDGISGWYYGSYQKGVQQV